jgi:hypothetical protein
MLGERSDKNPIDCLRENVAFNQQIFPSFMTIFKKVWVVVLLQIAFTSGYAFTQYNEQHSVAVYDWQSCVNTQSLQCVNGCQISEDIHCDDFCKQGAIDKCKEYGLSQP